ncbi:ParB/RepB/Spo0J family partition protein [Rhizobium lentis]|uniref:ParB family chromosome partitioning protein n=1 Tax=Rhizobium lentis TaxID=1138194 RepID=A0A7W8UQR8_9HYPH|nr:ParB/RepB/Spo0J family partition protein [Rhizobium lentis]MBB4574576.1 ParB family chromosome partitioning protein [Rhizobium lentis]MBB5550503.1 ParB family chromosome partitioning protein [Rhizobium lentis]MBB5561375.1 ParB family chromosome partitioning protein [Rhizobium lentis]MBB5567622.1 ParB family chromosome partitioning protein [Rhizobium lentis]
MAEANQKITLNVGRDIPFDKLVLSQQNVRKIKAGVSIDDLAEDIARRGLLTSLNVRAELDAKGNETGVYRIPAGGRRYRALELLVSCKRLAKTTGIPCVVSRGDTPEVEDSLAENVQRADLHPLDQYRAFQTLREQGLGEEEIAARFFVSVATVRQRLRLTSVSPRLLDLYADDEMTLEQVMAFSITNDHVRQEQVWDTISRQQIREPYYIRRLLTETAIRAGDRRAVYVGVDAYEAAGGVVMRDLFEQDSGGWLQDPALLEQLAIAKLKIEAEALQVEEGWKWVEAAFDFSYGHTSGLRRFFGKQAEMSEEELARHGALKAEYDKLDSEYAEAEAYSDEIERRLEELGYELDRINDRPHVFDPKEVARGGAYVSLAANGTLKIERGFVRPEDEPRIEANGEDAAEMDDAVGGDVSASSSVGGVSVNGKAVVGDQEEEDDTLRPLSDRLVLDLTATRTVALRNALANDPVIAFIAVLHAFVLKTFYLYGSDTCLELTLQSARFGQTEGLGDTVWAKEIEQRQEAWGQDLPRKPEDLWDFLIALDEVSRVALFAHCASLSLNAVIEPWNKRTRAIAHADQVARSIGFDMAGVGWVPTVDAYLGRVTKAHILQAVREAKGEQSAQLIDHLKKADMAREAECLLDGSGWLPEPLRLAIDDASAVGAETPADDGTEGTGDDAPSEDEGAVLPAFLTNETAETNESAAQEDLEAAE